MKIAVDVMGGDYGPNPLIEGCIEFVKKTGCKVVIIGDRDIISSKLGSENALSSEDIEIAHTDEYVSMGDRIAKVLKRKKKASIALAARLVKSGYCDGLFTVGNTGAAVSWGNIVLKKIRGVKKSALCSALPYPGGFTVLLDAGANIRSTGETLTQHAEMGSAVFKYLTGKENPTVGLINIGKEEGKGKLRVLRANYLLKKTKLNYIGYIEGNDLASGTVDVAVCDGFSGNVILKYHEGLLRAYDIKEKKDGYGALFEKLKLGKSKDAYTLNGAPLLGVNGVVVVGHGSSGAKDFESGLLITKVIIESGVLEGIKNIFSKTH
jgi:glycerol-3-phosphate acyltransferase PlsX